MFGQGLWAIVLTSLCAPCRTQFDVTLIQPDSPGEIAPGDLSTNSMAQVTTDLVQSIQLSTIPIQLDSPPTPKASDDSPGDLSTNSMAQATTDLVQSISTIPNQLDWPSTSKASQDSPIAITPDELSTSFVPSTEFSLISTVSSNDFVRSTDTPVENASENSKPPTNVDNPDISQRFNTTPIQADHSPTLTDNWTPFDQSNISLTPTNPVSSTQFNSTPMPTSFNDSTTWTQSVPISTIAIANNLPISNQSNHLSTNLIVNPTPNSLNNQITFANTVTPIKSNSAPTGNISDNATLSTQSATMLTSIIFGTIINKTTDQSIQTRLENHTTESQTDILLTSITTDDKIIVNESNILTSLTTSSFIPNQSDNSTRQTSTDNSTSFNILQIQASKAEDSTASNIPPITSMAIDTMGAQFISTQNSLFNDNEPSTSSPTQFATMATISATDRIHNTTFLNAGNESVGSSSMTAQSEIILPTISKEAAAPSTTKKIDGIQEPATGLGTIMVTITNQSPTNAATESTTASPSSQSDKIPLTTWTDVQFAITSQVTDETNRHVTELGATMIANTESSTLDSVVTTEPTIPSAFPNPTATEFSTLISPTSQSETTIKAAQSTIASQTTESEQIQSSLTSQLVTTMTTKESDTFVPGTNTTAESTILSGSTAQSEKIPPTTSIKDAAQATFANQTTESEKIQPTLTSQLVTTMTTTESNTFVTGTNATAESTISSGSTAQSEKIPPTTSIKDAAQTTTASQTTESEKILSSLTSQLVTTMTMTEFNTFAAGTNVTTETTTSSAPTTQSGKIPSTASTSTTTSQTGQTTQSDDIQTAAPSVISTNPTTITDQIQSTPSTNIIMKSPTTIQTTQFDKIITESSTNPATQVATVVMTTQTDKVPPTVTASDKTQTDNPANTVIESTTSPMTNFEKLTSPPASPKDLIVESTIPISPITTQSTKIETETATNVIQSTTANPISNSDTESELALALSQTISESPHTNQKAPTTKGVPTKSTATTSKPPNTLTPKSLAVAKQTSIIFLMANITLQLILHINYSYLN